MKKILLASVLAGLVATSSAFAYSPKDATLAASAPRPIASTVVNPINLPHSYKGEVLRVEFTLDAQGRPQSIELPSVTDPVLKARVVAAFRQWRFEADTASSGRADRRFVLPLEIKLAS